MNEAELMTALLKGSPIAVAILALGFSFWKWLLPILERLRVLDREAEAAREAARVARDNAWQTSLREIGASHKEATAVAVSGFKDALDRHDRAMDRYAAQHVTLAADVTSVKVDVASMRSDLHAVVSKFTTMELPLVASPSKKE